MNKTLGLAAVLLLLATVRVEAGPINGQVLFEKSERPVPNALIDFSCGSGKARAITADDGSYYVPELANGIYEVTITYRGAQWKFRRQIPEQGLIFRITS